MFDGLVAYRGMALDLLAGEEAERVQGELVSSDYFEVLGVDLAAGTGLGTSAGETLGASPVAVLSHAAWQRLYGGDSSVVGRSVVLNGQPFTVVGVAGEGFRGVNWFEPPDLWVPMAMRQELTSGLMARAFDARQALLVRVAGRLREGVGTPQAAEALRNLAVELERQYPAENKDRSIATVPLLETVIHPNVRNQFTRAGKILMAAVGLVLLIACANVANLLLARAVSRRKEFALRLAIGAGRGRLVRQLLTESLVLAACGALASLPLAVLTRDLLWRFRPPDFPLTVDLGLDWRVLGFTLGVTLLTGLLFGLAPALQSARVDFVAALKDDLPPDRGGRRRPRLRYLLVVAQVALSLVAMVGAGLFLRSLQIILDGDPGFEKERLLVVSFDPGAQRYSDERGRTLYEELVRRAATLPGAESAAMSENAPLSAGGFLRRVRFAGVDLGEETPVMQTSRVTPGYFETAGIAIFNGRGFRETDRAGAQAVAVVNETLAGRVWPNGEALGRRFFIVGEDEPYEVVGVARDSKYVSRGEDPQPYVYLSLPQRHATRATLFVRTTGDPNRLREPIRRLAREAAPGLPAFDLRTSREILEAAPWGLRMGAAFLGLFGLLALVLTVLGIYGVMAYSVSQRGRELAIRTAVGARPSGLLSLVVGQGMALVAVGLAVGLVAALLFARALSGFLFVPRLFDPLSFGGASLVFAAVALVATLVPALRTLRTEPALLLRDR